MYPYSIYLDPKVPILRGNIYYMATWRLWERSLLKGILREFFKEFFDKFGKGPLRLLQHGNMLPPRASSVSGFRIYLPRKYQG